MAEEKTVDPNIVERLKHWIIMKDLMERAIQTGFPVMKFRRLHVLLRSQIVLMRCIPTGHIVSVWILKRCYQ